MRVAPGRAAARHRHSAPAGMGTAHTWHASPGLTSANSVPMPAPLPWPLATLVIATVSLSLWTGLWGAGSWLFAH